jgi:MFS family permease
MTVICAMPVSALADRRRWRIPIITGAFIMYGVLLMIAPLPQTFMVWAVLALALAIVFSPIISIADSTIARMAIRHHLNYGTMRLWGSFGFAVMSISCGAIWEHFGFSAMFIVASLAVLPVLIFASMLEEGPPRLETSHAFPPFAEIFHDKGFIVLLITSFLIGTAITNSGVFDGIYMQHLGGNQFLVGLLFGLSAFSELPGMQFTERIVGRLGSFKTLLITYGLISLAYLGYALAWHPWLLLLMAMLKGSGFGLFYTSTIRLITARTPEHWASTVQAMLMTSAFGLAPLLANPLGGELYDRFGPESVYWAGSFAALMAMGILIFAQIRGLLR